jgi:hypothetical protein
LTIAEAEAGDTSSRSAIADVESGYVVRWGSAQIAFE